MAESIQDQIIQLRADLNNIDNVVAHISNTKIEGVMQLVLRILLHINNQSHGVGVHRDMGSDSGNFVIDDENELDVDKPFNTKIINAISKLQDEADEIIQTETQAINALQTVIDGMMVTDTAIQELAEGVQQTRMEVSDLAVAQDKINFIEKSIALLEASSKVTDDEIDAATSWIPAYGTEAAAVAKQLRDSAVYARTLSLTAVIKELPKVMKGWNSSVKMMKDLAASIADVSDSKTKEQTAALLNNVAVVEAARGMAMIAAIRDTPNANYGSRLLAPRLLVYHIPLFGSAKYDAKTMDDVLVSFGLTSRDVFTSSELVPNHALMVAEYPISYELGDYEYKMEIIYSTGFGSNVNNGTAENAVGIKDLIKGLGRLKVSGKRVSIEIVRRAVDAQGVVGEWSTVNRLGPDISIDFKRAYLRNMLPLSKNSTLAWCLLNVDSLADKEGYSLLSNNCQSHVKKAAAMLLKDNLPAYWTTKNSTDVMKCMTKTLVIPGINGNPNHTVPEGGYPYGNVIYGTESKGNADAISTMITDARANLGAVDTSSLQVADAKINRHDAMVQVSSTKYKESGSIGYLTTP